MVSIGERDSGSTTYQMPNKHQNRCADVEYDIIGRVLKVPEVLTIAGRRRRRRIVRDQNFPSRRIMKFEAAIPSIIGVERLV